MRRQRPTAHHTHATALTVQQKHLRALQQQPADGHAAALSAAEHSDERVTRRAAQRVHRALCRPLQLPPVCAVNLVLQRRHARHERIDVRVRRAHGVGHGIELSQLGLHGRQRGRNVVPHRRAIVQRRLLRQVAHPQALLDGHVTLERGVHAGQHLHERRLAAPVCAQDANLGAQVHAQRHALQQHLARGRHLVQLVHGENGLASLLRVRGALLHLARRLVLRATAATAAAATATAAAAARWLALGAAGLLLGLGGTAAACAVGACE
jgi:hypothetical protein